MESEYTVAKILGLYMAQISRQALIKADAAETIPKSSRKPRGKSTERVWDTRALPQIGERFGFLRKLPVPKCVAIFSEKGGVLKTTLALNLSRVAALHNVRTVVVGLDVQTDVTNALGFGPNLDTAESIEDILAIIGSDAGLWDVYNGSMKLGEVVQALDDLPTLSLIPECATLAKLESTFAINGATPLSPAERGPLWIRETTERLKQDFDLVILDCSPNWSLLVNGALLACDMLISPVECKPAQFQTLNLFMSRIAEFRTRVRQDFEQIYVPTRFAVGKKLSGEIRAYYTQKLNGCVSHFVRDAVACEEAYLKNISLPEYSAKSLPAAEMRQLLQEIWVHLGGEIREL
jgi:chromosome partitioning protein